MTSHVFSNGGGVSKLTEFISLLDVGFYEYVDKYLTSLEYFDEDNYSVIKKYSIIYRENKQFLVSNNKIEALLNKASMYYENVFSEDDTEQYALMFSDLRIRQFFKERNAFILEELENRRVLFLSLKDSIESDNLAIFESVLKQDNEYRKNLEIKPNFENMEFLLKMDLIESKFIKKHFSTASLGQIYKRGEIKKFELDVFPKFLIENDKFCFNTEKSWKSSMLTFYEKTPSATFKTFNEIFDSRLGHFYIKSRNEILDEIFKNSFLEHANFREKLMTYISACPFDIVLDKSDIEHLDDYYIAMQKMENVRISDSKRLKLTESIKSLKTSIEDNDSQELKSKLNALRKEELEILKGNLETRKEIEPVFNAHTKWSTQANNRHRANVQATRMKLESLRTRN